VTWGSRVELFATTDSAIDTFAVAHDDAIERTVLDAAADIRHLPPPESMPFAPLRRTTVSTIVKSRSGNVGKDAVAAHTQESQPSCSPRRWAIAGRPLKPYVFHGNDRRRL